MVYQKTSAIAEFDKWSHSYDRNVLQGLCFGPSHDMMLDRIEPGDQRLLDIGCGTGIFAERVMERTPNAQVYGLDLSSQMLLNGLSRWRIWADRYSIVRGDSERLPFADNLF